MGSALDEAMKVWWKLPKSTPAAERYIAALKAGLGVLEGAFQAQEDWTLEQLDKLLAKGLKVAIDGSSTHMGWSELAERHTLVKASSSTRDPFGEGALRINGQYAGTPDLIIQELNQPELVILDLKTTMNLKAEWIPKRLRGYDFANQTWQYPWAVQQVYGLPVRKFIYQLVIFYPKVMNLIIPVDITQERIDFWYKGAQVKWERMAWDSRFGIAPPNFDSCDGKYGLCPFIKACFDCRNDPERIRVYYDERGNDGL
jgi:hypothetical protein